jgi:tetratricopeptide (TPR) repeat protein
MTTIEVETYLKDPLYQASIQHFQKGEWEAGLDKLRKLKESYPLEAELRSLYKEMLVRAGIDQTEKADKRTARLRTIRSLGLRVALVVAVLSLVIWGFTTYSNNLRAQMAAVSERVTGEMEYLQLSTTLNDAIKIMQTGRLAEAKVKLDQLRASNPEFPGLAEAQKRWDELSAIQDQYNQAMQLKAQGDLEGALTILEEIHQKEPTYPGDVLVQITTIKRLSMLGDQLVQADNAYQSGDWDTAISAYRTVHSLDPDYKKDMVEGRLFTAYINKAQKLLDDNPESLDALKEADDYFRQAKAIRPADTQVQEQIVLARNTVETRLFRSYLDQAEQVLVDQSDSLVALQAADSFLASAQQLRPNDPEVKKERTMAQLFLQAQDAFSKGDWDGAIKNLSPIYTENMDYAAGTARQTLYDAYIFRGDNSMAKGEASQALDDYQAAASIAEQNPGATMRLFEAQMRVADALGILGNYETAVYLYRAAIDLVGSEQVKAEHPEIAQDLNNAEGYFRRNLFNYSFTRYHDAIRGIYNALSTVEVSVGEGEYLTKLAREYGTTAKAILVYNKLSSSKDVLIGTRIRIPVLPKP